MPEQPKERCERLIYSLADACAHVDADIILRGSVVRNDSPFGDLDVLAIGKHEEIGDLPEYIGGVAVSGSFIDPDVFCDYVDTTPRAWPQLDEQVFVGLAKESTVRDFLRQRRRQLIRQDLPDLLLYLAAEGVIYGQRMDLNANDYYSFKRHPGSKRTIMRTTFMAKALWPYVYGVQQTDHIMELLIDDGHVDPAIRTDIHNVLSMLGEGETYNADWKRRTARIQCWSDDITALAWEKARQELPPDYVSVAESLLHRLNDEALQQILAYNSTAPAHRKWVVDLLLAANVSTPPHLLASIWQDSQGAYNRKLIRRYLTRNPSFPTIPQR